MRQFPARRYRSGSANSELVEISAGGGQLNVWGADGSQTTLPYADVHLKLGGDSGRRLIIEHRQSGDVYFAENLQLLAELEAAPEWTSTNLKEDIAAARRQLRAAPVHEAKWWIGTIAVLSAIGIAIFAGVDMTVSWAERMVPPAVEEQIGKSAIESERRRQKLETDTAEARRVQEIGKRLLAQYPDNPYTFHFYINPSPDINAYALPGGHIVVNSQLVNVADSDDELAGVLAHEIGHVKGRHSLKSVLRQSGIWVCLSLLAGVPSQEQVALLSSLINLEGLQYSRKQETQADETSVELTTRAGYNPEGIITFFKRIEKEVPAVLNNKALSMLSTHPMPVERSEHLRKLIDEYRARRDSNSRPSASETDALSS